MNIAFIARISICIFVVGLTLCAYVDKQNEVTRCKIAIPKIQHEIDDLLMQKQKLTFIVDRFESPSNLLQLAKLPEYSHLRYPIQRDVFTLEEGFAMSIDKEEKNLQCSPKTKISLASRMGH